MQGMSVCVRVHVKFFLQHAAHTYTVLPITISMTQLFSLPYLFICCCALAPVLLRDEGHYKTFLAGGILLLMQTAVAAVADGLHVL